MIQTARSTLTCVSGMEGGLISTSIPSVTVCTDIHHSSHWFCFSVIVDFNIEVPAESVYTDCVDTTSRMNERAYRED